MPGKIPNGYALTDVPVDCWRVGHVMRWGTGFKPACWIDTFEKVSIRPGETGEKAWRRENKKQVPSGTYVFTVL